MGEENGRKIKFLAAVALLVGGMIGSAIFSMSGLTISYAGPAAIISWVIAAIVQLFYGLAMAELATTHRKNGGMFAFPEMTFDGEKGEFIGFISTWGNIMADVISIAFSAMYIGIYLSYGYGLPQKFMFICAIVFILICFFVNTFNFSTTGKINLVLALILAILLLVYSFISISDKNFMPENFIPFFSQGNLGSFGFLKAVPIAMIAYSSIISISFVSDEIDNPKKNIPKAVITGLIIVMCIYVFVLFATVGLISAKELNESGMVYLPLFAACNYKLTAVPLLSKFLSFAAIIALVTSMLVVMAISGRNIKAVADKNLLPSLLSKTSKNGVPIIAISIVTIAGIVLSFFPNIIDILINLGALFIVVTVIINFLSFIYTRKWKKGHENHFVAPFSNIVAVIILIILASCYIPDILKGGANLLLFSLIWYVMGWGVYIILKRKNSKINGK